MAVPNEEEPLNRVTVEPASAVPEIVGVVSLAAEEFDKDVGASGAVESIVIDKESEADDTLPAESVAVAVNK